MRLGAAGRLVGAAAQLLETGQSPGHQRLITPSPLAGGHKGEPRTTTITPEPMSSGYDAEGAQQQTMALVGQLQAQLRALDERVVGGEYLRLDMQNRLLLQEERVARAEQEAQQERASCQLMEKQLHQESVARQELAHQLGRLQASQEHERECMEARMSAQLADVTTQHQRLGERLNETLLAQEEHLGALEDQQEMHHADIKVLRDLWREGLHTMQESIQELTANVKSPSPVATSMANRRPEEGLTGSSEQ